VGAQLVLLPILEEMPALALSTFSKEIPESREPL
jgi:hypothetical protein